MEEAEGSFKSRCSHSYLQSLRQAAPDGFSLFHPKAHSQASPSLSLLPHSLHALPENGKTIPSKTMRETRASRKKSEQALPHPYPHQKSTPKVFCIMPISRRSSKSQKCMGKFMKFAQSFSEQRQEPVLVSPPMPRWNELISNN